MHPRDFAALIERINDLAVTLYVQGQSTCRLTCLDLAARIILSTHTHA